MHYLGANKCMWLMLVTPCTCARGKVISMCHQISRSIDICAIHKHNGSVEISDIWLQYASVVWQGPEHHEYWSCLSILAMYLCAYVLYTFVGAWGMCSTEL